MQRSFALARCPAISSVLFLCRAWVGAGKYSVRNVQAMNFARDLGTRLSRVFYAFLFGCLLSVAAINEARALPVLTSSLTDWGNISVFGPKITRSGGAKTEIVGQRTTWDLDGNGIIDSMDGSLVQNVWTQASVVAGTPIFKSFHDLEGSGIPLNRGATGVGSGWTGFRTDAGYSDMWTITVPFLAPATPLSPSFLFSLNGDLGYPGLGGGGTVLLPPNFYPFNPLWGDGLGGGIVIGPLPTAPTMDLQFVVNDFSWYDVQSASGEGTQVVTLGGPTFASGPPLTVLNGVAFKVDIDFIAGWQMAHAEASAFVPRSFEQFATGRVFDAAHSGTFAGLELRDQNGMLLDGFSLVDSEGTRITAVPVAPVPLPATILLLGVGGLTMLGAVHRRRAASK